MRLLDLYRHTDPTLARLLEDRIGLAALARAGGIERKPEDQGRWSSSAASSKCAPIRRGRRRRREVPRQRRRAAGRRARPRRLGHPRQRGCGQRTPGGAARRPRRSLAAIEKGMGPAWSETVVVLVTEFGRTARVNGTEGTPTAPPPWRCSPAAR